LTRNARQPSIEYIPPSAPTLRAFAKAVCEALSAQRGDSALASNDVIGGLASFLEVVTRPQAKQLNMYAGVLDDETD
jgi:hypothetical protein